jgi:hypothetical protein
MSLQAVIANPFMLLVNPEVVLAAVEKSEHLNNLNRHTCRPLDKPMPGTVVAAANEELVGDAADGAEDALEAADAAEAAASAQ